MLDKDYALEQQFSLEQKERDKAAYQQLLHQYIMTRRLLEPDPYGLAERINRAEREITRALERVVNAEPPVLSEEDQQRLVELRAEEQRLSQLVPQQVDDDDAAIMRSDLEEARQAIFALVPPQRVSGVDIQPLLHEAAAVERRLTDHENAQREVNRLREQIKFHPYATRTAPPVSKPADREAYLELTVIRALAPYTTGLEKREQDAPPASDQTMYQFNQPNLSYPQQNYVFALY